MELLYYPDPGLRIEAVPIARIDDEIRAVVEEMFDIMADHKGLGLAGTQVGYHRRIVVANMTGKKEDREVFINPLIIKKIGDIVDEEGCLSFPGITAKILRAERVVVETMLLDGKRTRIETEGLRAKMFQHEIDHLDGILMIDKMSPADKIACAQLLKELEEDFHLPKSTRGR